MFSTLPLSVQLAGLFESNRPIANQVAGDLQVVQANVDQNSVVVIAFDYSQHHGSLGSQEAEQLSGALRLAKQLGQPVVLLLNTSGVRVTEGTRGLAAYRQALRAALDAKLDGVPMLSLIARNCFGGGSMLAALGERRIINSGSLYAMSGPKLIEQISGSADLVASSKEAVQALMGGGARSEASTGFRLRADDGTSYRAAVIDWLRARAPSATVVDLRSELRSLRERLALAGRWPVARASAILNDDALVALASRLAGRDVGLSRIDGFIRDDLMPEHPVRVLGLIHDAADAVDVLQLAEAVAQVPDTTRSLLILLDCECHAARAADERLVLSEYFAHLALQVRARHRSGVDVHLVVTGLGGGGVFAALASAASQVSILPNACLRVLPRAAMAAINKNQDESQTTPAHALAAGAVDDIIDFS